MAEAEMGLALTVATILSSMPASPASQIPANLGITVRVYDYAEVPRSILAQAEEGLTRLFGETGLAVKLFECSPAAPELASADCLKPLGPAELVVRILPGLPPNRERVLGSSLGETHATVYYQRAVEFAARQLASEGNATGRILGCGMAHEIGHLLLGSMSHSPRGIMRGEWSREELRLISNRHLHFTLQEAEAMRAEVRRRMQHDGSALR